MKDKDEYLHSWYVLVMTFFSLLFLLISRHLIVNSLLMAMMFTFYFKNGLGFTKFRKLFLYSFLFSFGIFFLNILYPAQELKTGLIYTVMHMHFYEASLQSAFPLMIRLFFVSLLSMSSAAVINYTKVILYLIVHKGLKLFWGYPILLALNSIALFKEEYDRIKINARLRDLPFKDQFMLFFPLLVFAIRHSQRGALSLVTRGLNQQKTFYFTYGLSFDDKKRLFLFRLIYFALVIATFLPLR